MRTVWKYPVTPGEFTLFMPDGAVLLTVQAQDDAPMLWALVQAQANRSARYFIMSPTGGDIEGQGALAFVGTVQVPTATLGVLVWHLFERTTFH